MDIQIDEENLVKNALSRLLRQDICTSCLDPTLNYTVSAALQDEYNNLSKTLDEFTRAKEFNEERSKLQVVGMRYRLLMTRTLDEFVNTNANINLLSPNQMLFVQNLVVMGGKLQSYTQLLATASNHARIYTRIQQAAVLNELDGKDALEYLRRTKDTSTHNNNPSRSDIKELVTTDKKFENLHGIQNIVDLLRLFMLSIQSGLIDSFLFFIFYGIPGTGKTALAESLATEFSNGEYFKFDQSFFASTYLGVTESRIRNIFDIIRSNPNRNYTIIIDEADNVLRKTPTQSHLNSVKILLQTEINSYQSFGKNLIIIAITNYLNDIDQTFLRRATNLIPVIRPSIDDAKKFLESQLTTYDFPFSDVYRDSLKFSDNYVYTNSDMGRLAKNIKDTFLYNLNPNETVTIILYYQNQFICIFSNTDVSSMPRGLPTGFKNEKFQGTFANAMLNLNRYVKENNMSLENYRKYFAPSSILMNQALSVASTLTVEEASKYVTSQIKF